MDTWSLPAFIRSLILLQYTKPVEVGSHRFSQGQFLLPGQSLISPKKTFSALLRDDASFAVYRNSNKTLVWTSKPYPNPVKLCFSYHNALLLFQKKGSVLLSENQSDRKAGSCDLTLDDDGYLYIPGDRTGNTKWDVYNGGAWWSSQWNNEFWVSQYCGFRHYPISQSSPASCVSRRGRLSPSWAISCCRPNHY